MPSVQQPLQRGGSTALSRASLKDKPRLTFGRPAAAAAAAAAAFNSDKDKMFGRDMIMVSAFQQ